MQVYIIWHNIVMQDFIPFMSWKNLAVRQNIEFTWLVVHNFKYALHGYVTTFKHPCGYVANWLIIVYIS